MYAESGKSQKIHFRQKTCLLFCLFVFLSDTKFPYKFKKLKHFVKKPFFLIQKLVQTISKLCFLLGYEIREAQYQFFDIKLKKYIFNSRTHQVPMGLGFGHGHHFSMGLGMGIQ